jgi:hypothetical protein
MTTYISGSTVSYLETLIDEDVDNDLSEAINLGGATLIGIQMPATWTPADISFQASVDGTTYQDVMLAGSEYTLTVAASEYVMIPVDKSFLLPPLLKIKTSTGQAADRTLILVMRKR